MRTQGQGRLYPTWLTGGRVRAHVCMSWWVFFFPHYGQYSQDRMSGVQIQTVASMHVIPVCRTGCLAEGIKYHSSLPLPRLVAGEWGMFCNYISLGGSLSRTDVPAKWFGCPVDCVPLGLSPSLGLRDQRLLQSTLPVLGLAADLWGDTP